MYNMYRSRGISAVGSAFEWHSKGQGFDSPMLHQTSAFAEVFLYSKIPLTRQMGVEPGPGVNDSPVGCQSRADRAPARRERRLPYTPPNLRNPNFIPIGDGFGSLLFFSRVSWYSRRPAEGSRRTRRSAFVRNGKLNCRKSKISYYSGIKSKSFSNAFLCILQFIFN